jgi:hypothetical protein
MLVRWVQPRRSCDHERHSSLLCLINMVSDFIGLTAPYPFRGREHHLDCVEVLRLHAPGRDAGVGHVLEFLQHTNESQ